MAMAPSWRIAADFRDIDRDQGQRSKSVSAEIHVRVIRTASESWVADARIRQMRRWSGL